MREAAPAAMLAGLLAAGLMVAEPAAADGTSADGAAAGGAAADGRAAGGASPIDPSAIYGDWLTGDLRGVIRITACGTQICGQIIGQVWRAGTPQPIDNKGRVECGQTILHGTRTGTLLWSGEITDPDDGSTYRATYRLVGPDTLALRGYILLPLFGQTQDWTRFHGPIGSACRFTPPDQPGRQSAG